ncbi:hypothetical protein Drorol1_Dr00003803 [Drosera rotundifolia]
MADQSSFSSCEPSDSKSRQRGGKAVSKPADFSSRLKVQQGGKDCGDLITRINTLKKQIHAERRTSIRGKIKRNAKKLDSHIDQVLSATSAERLSAAESGSSEVLSIKTKGTICVFNGFVPGSADKNCTNGHDATISTSTKLPFVEKIPPYTTWISLDRNQRMAEDQSVFGRRLIYYDENGDEALICSDAEGENLELGEEKYEFSEGEDRILWMAFQDYGFNDEVVNIVSHFIGGSCTEIQERYHELKDKILEGQGEEFCQSTKFLEKSLATALDSLDNLFCRRCLIFDCRLHGCSQILSFPSERQSSWSEMEDARKPCSHQCFLMRRKKEDDIPKGSTAGLHCHINDMANKEETTSSSSNSEEKMPEDGVQDPCTEGPVSKQVDSQSLAIVPLAQPVSLEKKRKACEEGDSLMEGNDDCLGVNEKKRKIADDLDKESASSASALCQAPGAAAGNLGKEFGEHDIQLTRKHDVNEFTGTTMPLGSPTVNQPREWMPLEKDLFLKGVEIFGRNSCLIARNLLSGLKTCSEVYGYMLDDGALTYHRTDAVLSSLSEEKEKETSIRSRLTRKRGKARRLKYSSKSTGHPSSWRRIGDGKNKPCRQYTPCPCQSTCGQNCPCMENGTCCEKYCGCSKSCKNRFRGCHCAKSQCKSRQCPCYASNRECDPDVCRNCWISCGDGSLGEPPRQSDGQCENMKLLLRQHQPVLLAKSEVAGWGAFIKNSVNKNEFLGEYTGELISHQEADRRGKFYDRVNSSFLFDLNDQWVLDAFRKGDKLKFANHSYNPNCHCKIMLVSGDHRVGIYAKDRIEAKEELFYDYCYGPNEAPEWARKRSVSSKDDSSFTLGRARKHQSR